MNREQRRAMSPEGRAAILRLDDLRARLEREHGRAIAAALLYSLRQTAKAGEGAHTPDLAARLTRRAEAVLAHGSRSPLQQIADAALDDFLGRPDLAAKAEAFRAGIEEIALALRGADEPDDHAAPPFAATA